MSVKAPPILAVRNVRASARWYARILGSAEPTGSAPSDHDHIYRRIYVGDQLHAWDEEDHRDLVDAKRAPGGHGMLVWFVGSGRGGRHDTSARGTRMWTTRSSTRTRATASCGCATPTATSSRWQAPTAARTPRPPARATPPSWAALARYTP